MRRSSMAKRVVFLISTAALFVLVGLFVDAYIGQLRAQPQQAVQVKGGEDETGPYEVAEDWPKPLGHKGWIWGSQGGVFAESPNRIYIVQRGELPVPERAPEGYT